MSKFCTSCGAELNDNATFCTNCGAQLGSQPQQPGANAQTTQNFQGGAAAAATPADNVKKAVNGAINKVNDSKYKNYIIVGVAGVLVIVLVIVLLCILLGGGYKKPIDNFVKVCEKGDGKAYEAMMITVDDDDDDDDTDYDEEAEKIQEKIEKKYGEDVSVSYEIKKKKQIDDDDLDDINDLLDGDKEIKDAYTLKVKFKFKGDDESGTETASLVVIKYDGKWGFMYNPYSTIFSGYSSFSDLF